MGFIIFGGVEIGQFAVSPVMEPAAFGALAGRKALPCTWFEVSCDLRSSASHGRFASPRAKVVVRSDPQNIAFAGAA